MRLTAARIQKYRSIRDTGLFEVSHGKTILVGPNEAGKTAILRALQQINPPQNVPKFDALRDYPRAEYNAITTGAADPARITVAEAHFVLEENDLALLPGGFKNAKYVFGRHLDNSAWHRIVEGPPPAAYSATVKKVFVEWPLTWTSNLDRRASPLRANSSARSPPHGGRILRSMQSGQMSSTAG